MFSCNALDSGTGTRQNLFPRTEMSLTFDWPLSPLVAFVEFFLMEALSWTVHKESWNLAHVIEKDF